LEVGRHELDIVTFAVLVPFETSVPACVEVDLEFTRRGRVNGVPKRLMVGDLVIALTPYRLSQVGMHGTLDIEEMFLCAFESGGTPQKWEDMSVAIDNLISPITFLC
jgi:hypothetical protein